MNISTQRHEEIRQVLLRHPEGLTSSAITAALRNPPHQRTVQRWLAELAAAGMVTVSGRARATVYQRTTTFGTAPVLLAEPAAAFYATDGIPLSEQGREVLAYVRRPRTGRTPVGYNRNFLDDYVPNLSWYLSEATRRHLRRIGETDAFGRPAGTHGRAILNRLLIDLSWASSRLEGNTYSRLDTQNLIESGRHAEGKDAQETQMILNHKAAIELVLDEADRVGFDAQTLLSLHGLLSENLMPDPDASGRLRFRPVQISGSVFIPLAMPQTIEECFRSILCKATAITDPFEQAFFALVHIPYLQPFEDVNKRVSRLAANIPLIKNNLSPLTFIDVPDRTYIDAILGVYEMNRIQLLQDLFVWAYERSAKQYVAVRKSLADPDPLRLRYRPQLREIVVEIVRSGRQDVLHAMERFADEQIEAKDREAFVEMVQDELKRLHPGTLARYRLRLSEFEAWRKARKALMA